MTRFGGITSCYGSCYGSVTPTHSFFRKKWVPALDLKHLFDTIVSSDHLQRVFPMTEDLTKPDTDTTRERILEAAEEVFAEKGFKQATVREILKRAAVGN